MCFIMHLTDAQPTGFVHMKYKRFFRVKEMMPELVVPDLKDCKVCTYYQKMNQWKFDEHILC